MIPSIISLLATNGHLDQKDLGRLACVSPSLRQFICADDSTDQNIWKELLYKRWPSTSMMPLAVSQRFKYRKWYERLSGAILWPGTHGGKSWWIFGESIAARRAEYREQWSHVKTRSGKEHFSPLPAPSLSPDDLMFLIDVYSDEDQVLVSSALYGDALGQLFYESEYEVSTMDIPPSSIISTPQKLKLVGCQFRLMKEQISKRSSILAMRLSDNKVMSVFKSEYDGYSGFHTHEYNPSRTTGYYSVFGDKMGFVPTLLTSRINHDFVGLCFCMQVRFSLPRSPRSFGNEYTINKYRKDCNEASKLWSDQPSKNAELLPFFAQTEKLKSEDGNYYGKVNFVSFYVRPVGMESHFHFGDISLNGVTLLHALDDLFDHNEPELEQDNDFDDEYGDY